MDTALTVPPREVQITQDQTALIKATICQGATDAEMKLFFYDCQRRGVHPLDKLIHFTKRSGKYTPITSIDFMRQRAHGSGAYAGEEPAEYELNLEDGLPDTCTYSVYRLVQGQRCKWTATARWNEYYPGDQQGFMWKKMPYLMLAKCAEALALRKAFPEQLQGLYVKEEMDQAGPMTHGDPAAANGPAAGASSGGGVSAPPVAHASAPSDEAPMETQDSLVADWKAAIDADIGPESRQATWDKIVKDGRLSGASRASLYKHVQGKAKGK